MIYRAYQIYYYLSQMSQPVPEYNHNKDDHYLVRINRDFKCICELCNCGKHKCPRPTVKGTFDTSYADHYQNYTIQPHTTQPKYHYQQRHYNPQTLTTHYQQTYLPQQPIQVHSPSRMQHIGREILKSGPFVANTSYLDQYKPFQIQPAIEESSTSIANKETPRRADLKFEGVSSYKQQFNSPPIPKIQRYKHPQAKNQSPFIGQSSYKSEFMNYKVQPSVETHVQAINSSNRKVKFQGSSTYNRHFKAFQVRPDPRIGPCQLDSLALPSKNYSSNNDHIFYDHHSKQFV